MLGAMSQWSLFDDDADDDDDDGDDDDDDDDNDEDDDGDETNDHTKLWRRRRHDDVYHNVRWMTIECACYHFSSNLASPVQTLLGSVQKPQLRKSSAKGALTFFR